jgi:hypothetical protein
LYTFATIVRQFNDADLAASFLDFLIEQEEL